MNAALRTLFFLSALAPAVIVAAAIQLYAAGEAKEFIAWVVASCLALAFPFLVIRAAQSMSGVLPFSAKKIESQDWLFVTIIATYFVPVVVKFDSLWTIAALASIAAVVLATLEAIPCHPVLHVARYRFYKVEGTNGTVYVLITRRRLLTAADLKSVKQLSPQLLLDAHV